MAEHSGPCILVPAVGTFYRSVRSRAPLSREDFLSQAQQPNRKPRRTDPTFLQHWNGVSVNDTAQQTRANAERYKWKLGEFIAVLVIPVGSPILYERLDDRGHGNLYGASPEELMERVIEVLHESELDESGPPGT